MKLRYLLDTNTLSEPLRKIPNAAVLAKIHIHQQKIAIATPILYEIARGAYRLPESRKRSRILEYIQDFILVQLPILPYDDAAALWQAAEVARLVQLGLTSSPIDGQIAAIAKSQNLILVTRNVSDFQYFQDLQIENWFK
ncbi:twitching motility protein PilT [Achromatium sp. WMS3]|nr:twitching motility protein PilT [Achromatium sp. WMS3]